MSEQVGIPRQDPAPVAPARAKSGSRRWLISVLLVSLVAAGIGGGWMLLRSNPGPDDAAAGGVASTSPARKAPTATASASASPSVSPTNAAPAPKVISGRDPFAELDVIKTVAKASALAEAKAAAKAAAKEAAAAASAKAANPASPVTDLPTTEPTVPTVTAYPTLIVPTITAAPTASSTPTSTATVPVARSIKLVATHADTASAEVEVNGVPYDVAVGQVFSSVFQLQAVQSASADFLYGDATITLPVGETKSL